MDRATVILGHNSETYCRTGTSHVQFTRACLCCMPVMAVCVLASLPLPQGALDLTVSLSETPHVFIVVGEVSCCSWPTKKKPIINQIMVDYGTMACQSCMPAQLRQKNKNKKKMHPDPDSITDTPNLLPGQGKMVASQVVRFNSGTHCRMGTSHACSHTWIHVCVHTHTLFLYQVCEECVSRIAGNFQGGGDVILWNPRKVPKIYFPGF